MSYVREIRCWKSGTPVTDGVPVSCEPGDFPEVHYDLPRIAAEVDRDRLPAGPASLWRYWPLLPADDPANAVSLGEGWTPLLPAPRLGEALGCRDLWIKDEGRNPSGTFKDRGASVATTRLRELGIETVVENSSGNAAAAWGMYAARAGIRCVNLVPADTLPASLCQSAASGADTVVLDGPWQESGAMVAEAASAMGWFNVSTFKEPHRLEGKKTMGLELAEQFGWELPDAIIYPTGGGLGAVAIYKAFRELQALGWIKSGPLPKLIVVQYEGCAPVVKAYRDGADHAEVWTDLDVPPGGLKSTRPPGDRVLLRLVRETGGSAVTVSTDASIAAAEDVARREGLFACPEAGTTIAGLRQALADRVVDAGERAVLMFTGSGMKSIPVFPAPACRTVASGDTIAG
jgi:threonine synthase